MSRAKVGGGNRGPNAEMTVEAQLKQAYNEARKLADQARSMLDTGRHPSTGRAAALREAGRLYHHVANACRQAGRLSDPPEAEADDG